MTDRPVSLPVFVEGGAPVRVAGRCRATTHANGRTYACARERGHTGAHRRDDPELARLVTWSDDAPRRAVHSLTEP